MDFETDFWKPYPRKIARKKALKAWMQLTDAQRFAAVQSLPIHLRYWEAAGTSAEFLPYASTWLNGEHWADELEMPEVPDAAWWKTTKGIEAKAAEVGVSPKPGEDWHSLKARILAKERAA